MKKIIKKKASPVVKKSTVPVSSEDVFGATNESKPGDGIYRIDGGWALRKKSAYEEFIGDEQAAMKAALKRYSVL